jgi:hypothetical protein
VVHDAASAATLHAPDAGQPAIHEAFVYGMVLQVPSLQVEVRATDEQSVLEGVDVEYEVQVPP